MAPTHGAKPDLSRVRSRTRTLLIEAAVALFGRKTMAIPPIHEIASNAGVATGTFYNYFRTREELLEAAMVERLEGLLREITRSYASVPDPAERMAVGCRRFILQAGSEPLWAVALLRVWSTGPDLLARMLGPMLADLRAGKRRGRFTYERESAAFDLSAGAVAAAIRRVLEKGDAEACAASIVPLILRALGVPNADAMAIVARPLPAAPGETTAASSRRRRTPGTSASGRPHRSRS
jgi:AcrR family transcriptional regulator